MMLVGAAAAYLMRDGLKSVDAHPGIRAIAEGGHAIVWIYVLRIGRRHVHKASVLQLGLASGEIAQIELKREGDEGLLRDLLELAPHATVGYDPIYERRFRVNPAALRRG
ncbi:MAG: hypothetical protein ACXVDD_05225 [Polyangia bacterium]